MEGKLQGYTKNRLKSSTFIHEANKLKTTLALDMPVTPLCMADTMNPVEIDTLTVTICTKVPHLEQGTDDDKTMTLAMICEQYSPEAWTNVYTDGSSANVIQDSGESDGSASRPGDPGFEVGLFALILANGTCSNIWRVLMYLSIWSIWFLD